MLREIEVIAVLTRKAIFDNTHGDVSSEEFTERNSGYELKYKTAKERISQLNEQKSGM